MAVIPYLKSNTEQKQRGFIIANEYGGPIDVASWVLYHENLEHLPNTYEGKYVYVYEDNEIFFNNGTEWVQWTNKHRVAQDKTTPDFKLLFYVFPSNTPIQVVNDASSSHIQKLEETSSSVRTGKPIEARLFVKPEGFSEWIQFNNETKHTGQQIDYPSKLTLRWFLNNRGNEVTSLATGNLMQTLQLYDQSGFKEAVSQGNYSSDHLICVAYYDGFPIASSKLWICGNKDATDVKRGMLYLTSKTPQLQRGFIMSSEEGGGVDATSTVNSTSDLREFTNNYLGKLVYSYSSFTDFTVSDPRNKAPKTYVDGYTYYANDKASWYPKTSLSQEEKIIEIKEKSQGRYVPIGGLDMRNEIQTRWEITGKNYGPIKSIVNDDDLGASDIPERHRRGYDIHYESHMYIAINGVETEIPVVDTKDKLMASDHSVGAVWYQWTVKKPLGAEYYDPGDYEPGSGGMTPSSGADYNRTVWIRDLDYKIDNNGNVVGINGERFTHDFFKTGPYTGSSTGGIVTRDGQSLECLYTNDYDDDDIVEIWCTAYFKDESGSIRTKQSPTLIVSVDNEHLVYVYPESKQGSQSGIKDITPDVGTFIIHGAPTSTTADFRLNNNEYQVGYRIVHYKNATDAANRTNETVLYLHSSDSSENVNILTLDEVVDQSSGSDKKFKFTFHVTNNTSKIPFGWYRVEVFRNSFAQSETDPDLKLYVSSPKHFFQEVTNTSSFVSPYNVWLGYYRGSGEDINLDHWYRATIDVRGKNLLTKDIPMVENGHIVKKNTSSVLYVQPNNNWIDGVEVDATTGAKSESISVNGDYTKIDGYFDFRDPRTQNSNKNRKISMFYYAEDDTIKPINETISVSISVYNILLPDLDLVVDSIYKRPTGEDIFIYNTIGYTMVNPAPYGCPYVDCTDESKWEKSLPSGVVTDFVKRYNRTPYSSSPRLVFKKDVQDGFEIYARVNNPSSVIVDSSHYSAQDLEKQRYFTGRVFNPEVYNIAVSIEQPSIQNDSDFYSIHQDYEIIAHVWWSTSDSATYTNYPGMENTPWHKYLSESSEWTEFTDAELGNNATFRWKENSDLDIWYSNTSPSSSSSRKKDLSVTLGNGDRNVFLWFDDPALIFAYTKLEATLFGTYVSSCVDEIKVRNPIDALSVSHKIYTGTNSRLDKNYGKAATRQLEEEWIELTITPTLVDWFGWSDLKTTLKLVINDEEVDESSNKYKIEYDGTRNHFYEGTFRVYWKRNADIPDTTTNFVISLNKCTAEHTVPIELIALETMHLYPWNYSLYGGPGSYPEDNLVYINAKVGTKQRYVLEIDGQNLDTDSRFLTLRRGGFKETNQDAVSLPGTETESIAGSDIFKKIQATSTKIVYYIEESAVTNKKYTVTFNDASSSYTRVAHTYLYNDQSIKGFGTSSAYYKNSDGSGYSFLDAKWIGISSSFEPSVIYDRVVPNNTVTTSTTKFTSKVEYDMHSVGIVSGDNVLSNSKDDVRELYSISMTRSLDTFTAVIKNHSEDVSSSLPSNTLVRYRWSHDGSCYAEAPSNTMDLNYVTLYNDQDVDVNENVTLKVTILHHGSSFTNYLGQRLSMSDYVMTTTQGFSIPRLLYDMTIALKNINLTIGKAYSMSEVIDSITCEMYRRDKSHNLETIVYSGNSLDSVENKKLVFSVANITAKPSTINNKKVTVTTNKGSDILVEWKRTEADTKVSKTVSLVSNIVKTSISISPKSGFWDLKSVPTVNTTVTLVGQNLMYAYSIEGDELLKVVEKNHTDHNKSFNPGISSNASGTYTYSSTYTDTGHNLGYDGNGNAIDDEERVYEYKFGSNSASYTAVYQNRKIISVTIDPKCVISNKEGEISTGFSISAVNMFGPNTDIKNNEYDLTWASSPEGSTLTGKFNSSAGNTGVGTLKLAETSLSSDTPVSISVTRESNTKTFSGSINVAKITGIDTASNKTYVSNGKLTVTVKGQHLDCAGTIYVGISGNGSSYTSIGTATSTNATTFTISDITYDNATYYGGVDKHIKVWIDAGDKAGQYATHVISATSPSSVTLYATNISGNTVACTATSGTISWHGKGVASYSDGSSHTMFDRDGFSQSVGINKNCCTTKAEDLSKTVTWTVRKTDSIVSAYNLTTDYSINVTGTIHQNGDTITSTTYVYTNHSWSNIGNVGCGEVTVSVSATATPVYAWTSCGSTTTGTPTTASDSKVIASNCHSTTSKTTSVTLLGQTETVTQARDYCDQSSTTSYTSWVLDGTLNDVACTTESAVIRTKRTKTVTTGNFWRSDGASCGASSSSDTTETDSCTVTFGNNKHNESSRTISSSTYGACNGVTWSFTQARDYCDTSSSTSYSDWTLNGSLGNVACNTTSVTIYVKRTKTVTTSYTWRSDGASCKQSTSSSTTETDYCNRTFGSNCHNTSSRTISSSEYGACNGVSWSFTQAGDTCNSSSSTSYSNWVLDGTPGDVACSTESKTIYVKRTKTVTTSYYWGSDGASCSQSTSSDTNESDYCNRTFGSNCGSASARTISSSTYGACNGVSWSFTQAGDPCNGLSITGAVTLPSGGACYKSYTITASATNGTPSISVSPTPYSVSGSTYTFKRQQNEDFTFVATASLSGCDSKTFSGTVEKLSEPTSWTSNAYVMSGTSDVSSPAVSDVWRVLRIMVEVTSPNTYANASNCGYSYTKYLGDQSTMTALYASNLGTLRAKYTITNNGAITAPRYADITLGSDGVGYCDIDIPRSEVSGEGTRNIVFDYEIPYSTSFTSSSYPGVTFNVGNSELGGTDGLMSDSVTLQYTGGGGGGDTPSSTLCKCLAVTQDISSMDADPNSWNVTVNTSITGCSNLKSIKYRYYPTAGSNAYNEETLIRPNSRMSFGTNTHISYKDPTCVENSWTKF